MKIEPSKVQKYNKKYNKITVIKSIIRCLHIKKITINEVFTVKINLSKVNYMSLVL